MFRTNNSFALNFFFFFFHRNEIADWNGMDEGRGGFVLTISGSCKSPSISSPRSKWNGKITFARYWEKFVRIFA